MAPEREERGARPRAFWSGTLSFGLVSIPVDFYTANRSRPVSLRLLGPDGTPLRRRYRCPAEQRLLEPDDIVRGYEIEDGRFVLVSDEELDALAPEKSRDVDLRLFVDRDELDPIFFARGYYLAPGRGSTKAYGLLADTMEKSGRAGIATFVMRGVEYLVAILAEEGLLRAETLRFAEELRTPADVGLPDPESAAEGGADELAGAMAEEIEALSADDLDREELADRQIERLVALAEDKRRRSEDLFEAPPEAAPEEAAGDVIDLMEALKRQLAEDRGGSEEPRLERASKRDLYERARALNIPGRSKMTRRQLLEAIRRAS